MGVEQIVIFAENEHWKEENFKKILEILKENYKKNQKIFFFSEYFINEKDIQEILSEEKTNSCLNELFNFLLSNSDRISIYPMGVNEDGNERKDKLYKKFVSIYDKVSISNAKTNAFILIGSSYKDYFFKRIKHDYNTEPIVFLV